MRITDVRMRLLDGGGKMKAIVSITIDNEFVVHDIKIVNGDKGLFVAMPSRHSSDGLFRDIAHPITSEARSAVQEAILEKYRQELQNAPAPSEA